MRVKRGVVTKRKHKKLLNSTKGYMMTKRRLVRVAKEAQLHAGQYAFAGRRLRKGDFRSLWITRIGEAVKQQGISYSQFLGKLKKAKIEVDRKIMANLIVEDPSAFKAIVEKVK